MTPSRKTGVITVASIAANGDLYKLDGHRKPAHKVTLSGAVLVPLTRLSRDERFEQTQNPPSVRLHGAFALVWR
jgi:hypothetical protein